MIMVYLVNMVTDEHDAVAVWDTDHRGAILAARQAFVKGMQWKVIAVRVNA